MLHIYVLAKYKCGRASRNAAGSNFGVAKTAKKFSKPLRGRVSNVCAVCAVLVSVLCVVFTVYCVVCVVCFVLSVVRCVLCMSVAGWLAGCGFSVWVAGWLAGYVLCV